MYNVFYTAGAARHLQRLPHDIRSRIENVVEDLSSNPRTFHTEKLEGHPNAYRLRVGDYRVVFTIDDHTKTVTIYRIRHRREAYR